MVGLQEPEVWEFLQGVDKLTDEYGTRSARLLVSRLWLLSRRCLLRRSACRLLCEVHEDFKLNLSLAAKGYYVYDFALPLLVLHAMHWSSALNLRRWMRICPRRQITVLDTHDGMVRPRLPRCRAHQLPVASRAVLSAVCLAGHRRHHRPHRGEQQCTLASSFNQPPAWRLARAASVIRPLQVCDQEQLQEVVEKALGCGPNFKYYYKNGTYTGVPHQYNCTYFSAVGSKVQDYLLARAIQFFTPGMPMVYYNGLLAGTNDFKVRPSLGLSHPS